MDAFVNIKDQIQSEIMGSGITIGLDGDKLTFSGPGGMTSLRVVQLYRPSSQDVEREAAPDTVLVITAASSKAAKAAKVYNHILAPDRGYRIIAPGIALSYFDKVKTEISRQVRLTGLTGVIAESLLLEPNRMWTVTALANSANVSPALAHRVLTRLETEGLIDAAGNGPEKTRLLNNAKALAELWADEERPAKKTVRGYLYASTQEALAQKIIHQVPGGAISGILAANSYQPVLTRVNPPLQVWIPESIQHIERWIVGFEPTREGANVEFRYAVGDPWAVHATSRMSKDGLQQVSKWRAWMEISHEGGRTKELADALFASIGEI